MEKFKGGPIRSIKVMLPDHVTLGGFCMSVIQCFLLHSCLPIVGHTMDTYTCLVNIDKLISVWTLPVKVIVSSELG